MHISIQGCLLSVLGAIPGTNDSQRRTQGQENDHSYNSYSSMATRKTVSVSPQSCILNLHSEKA